MGRRDVWDVFLTFLAACILGGVCVVAMIGLYLLQLTKLQRVLAGDMSSTSR